MKRTDSEIKTMVSEELRADTRVKETHVGVEVDRGVVTLTGTVSSYGERQAAQRAAHRVAGVLDVANDIQVKVPGSAATTDTELAQFVRGALEWDVFVPEQKSLRPKVVFSGDKRPSATEIAVMHHSAHENCFIALSVRSEVSVEPQ